MCVTKNGCQTLSHYDDLGAPILKSKKKYNTHDKAVEACKTLNLQKHQIKKLVTYKCRVCHKYHIGRNGNDINAKYIRKLRRENDRAGNAKLNISIKVVGKIDLSKF
tara:strand:- start:2280 stop:2600 length:321 start_codon:yes stop_codon:yes gene_type:complete